MKVDNLIISRTKEIAEAEKNIKETLDEIKAVNGNQESYLLIKKRSTNLAKKYDRLSWIGDIDLSEIIIKRDEQLELILTKTKKLCLKKWRSKSLILVSVSMLCIKKLKSSN